jgi:hypothetical protein
VVLEEGAGVVVDTGEFGFVGHSGSRRSVGRVDPGDSRAGSRKDTLFETTPTGNTPAGIDAEVASGRADEDY